MIALVIVALISVGAASLAYLTLSQARDRSAYYFGAIVALVALWVPASHIGNSNMFSPDNLGWFTYADYIIGVWALAAVCSFALDVTSRSGKLQIIRVLAPSLAALLVTALLLSGKVIGIDTLENGFVRSEKQSLYVVYVAYGVLTLLLSIGVLVRRLWMAHGSEDKRLYESIVVGFVSAGVLVLIGTFLVPALTDDRLLRTIGAQAAYVGVVVVTYFIWNAIFRYGLFSIGQAAVRATVYVLAIIVLLPLYAGFGIIGQLLLSSGEPLGTRQVLISVISIIPIMLLYPTAKGWFDKATNTLFFRDTYDSNAFFAELNNALVTHIDVERLLQESRQIIQKNMRAESVSFLLLTTSYYEVRSIGDQDQEISDDDVGQLRTTLPNIRKKVVYSRAPGQSPMESSISHILESNNVRILARIIGNVQVNSDGIGYLLLGRKRNGKPYTEQDIAVLENVADAIQLAVENALRFEEIQQFNITLQNKIDAATKELQKSNDKLKELDEAKDEFISMASHQLRTPLTSIKGYASMMTDGDLGEVSEGQKKMLGQILFSSQRMVSLITDMLNVSRLKTGKFVIKKSPVHLPDIIETELEQVTEGAAAKSISLVYDKPREFSKVELDETKIRQVIMNFVDNAIYYTQSGGTITVKLVETDKAIEFTVKDTGMGVPKDQQHKLFTKFYRAENAKLARPDGTGLGLFMAKKVVVAQGGSIVFGSEEGSGSTFGFNFPKN